MNKSGRPKQVRIPASCSTQLANLLGYLEGDGYLSETSLEVLFSHKELSLIDHYLSILEAEFELKRGQPRLDPGLHRYRFHRKALKDWLREIGVKSKIPHVIETEEQKRAWLRGFFTADGTVSTRGNPSIEGTHTQIMDACGDLLKELGLEVSRYTRPTRTMRAGYIASETRIIYVQTKSVALFKERIGFDLEEKQRRLT